MYPEQNQPSTPNEPSAQGSPTPPVPNPSMPQESASPYTPPSMNEPSTPTPSTPSPSAPTPMAMPKKGGTNKIFVYVAVGVIVLLVVIAAVFILPGYL